MEQKRTFMNIFVVGAIILSVLPLIMTFSSLLTSVFDSMGWYVWLQKVVVPYESRYVGLLARLVGVNARVAVGERFSLLLEKSDGTLLPVVLEWNCLGWQSLILLGLTLVTGLRGRYTPLSKLEVVMIGVLGTFLVNLFRMVFIVSLVYYWNSLAAVIVHDYLASFVALVWMIFFWWFSYAFVLEERAAYRE